MPPDSPGVTANHFCKCLRIVVNVDCNTFCALVKRIIFIYSMANKSDDGERKNVHGAKRTESDTVNERAVAVSRIALTRKEIK